MRRRWIFAGFVLLFGVFFLDRRERSADSSNVVEVLPADLEFESSPPSAPIVTSNADSLVSDRQLNTQDCFLIDKLLIGPEGYAIDQWFASWGAPPVFGSADALAAYANYDEETLSRMAKSGTRGALHSLGLQSAWRALTSFEGPISGMTVWDIGSAKIPFSTSISGDELASARMTLEQAAFAGNSYALIDIAVTYVKEMQGLEYNGQILLSDRGEFLALAFAYGEAVEELVPELDESFFTVSLPPEYAETAIQMRSAIVKKVADAHRQLGIDRSRALDATSAGLYQRQSRCR